MFKKCSFQQILIASSGGIDSAVCSVLATLAIGKENVHLISMPTRFSSSGSVSDSIELAKNLSCKHTTLSIESFFSQFEKKWSSKSFEAKSSFGKMKNITRENLQSRLRGLLVMACSNNLHSLVLATGNKSEIALGYSTLYGDTNGGLAPLGDCLKTDVYKIAKAINSLFGEIIPKSILLKAPSAELHEGQFDQQTLPPYPTLDKILQLAITKGMSENEVGGFKKDRKWKEAVEKVFALIRKSEFKRQQLPPLLRISQNTFGRGLRMPIAKNSSHNSNGNEA